MTGGANSADQTGLNGALSGAGQQGRDQAERGPEPERLRPWGAPAGEKKPAWTSPQPCGSSGRPGIRWPEAPAPNQTAQMPFLKIAKWLPILVTVILLAGAAARGRWARGAG